MSFSEDTGITFLKRGGIRKHRCEKTQTEEILRDFPWLWAVKSCWASRYDAPRVNQDMQILMTYFMQPVHHLADFGLWIAFVEPGNDVVWQVAPVVPSADSKYSWAEEVRRHMPLGSDPLYIATKIGDRITIYRHPGGSRGMKDFVEETACVVGSNR